MAGLALLIVVLAGPISAALALPAVAVAILGVSLFFAGMFTFAVGLLQGLARFGWMGSVLIVQAGSRLVLGVALVLLGFGVNGAFAGAAAAIAVSVIVAALPIDRDRRAGER
jgi:O-antigen/teichoic acid export membrane protein